MLRCGGDGGGIVQRRVGGGKWGAIYIAKSSELTYTHTHKHTSINGVCSGECSWSQEALNFFKLLYRSNQILVVPLGARSHTHTHTREHTLSPSPPPLFDASQRVWLCFLLFVLSRVNLSLDVVSVYVLYRTSLYSVLVSLMQTASN